MIELHVRFLPEGIQEYYETPVMLSPDQDISPYYEGSFNWIATYDGKTIKIPQANIHSDPTESDIDFNGIPIVESKREIVKKIEAHLNDELR